MSSDEIYRRTKVKQINSLGQQESAISSKISYFELKVWAYWGRPKRYFVTNSRSVARKRKRPGKRNLDRDSATLKANSVDSQKLEVGFSVFRF